VCCQHLRIAHELGLSAFRGNQRVWFHRASKETEQSLTKRAARFADTYLPFAGHHAREPQIVEGLVDVTASRFLRPVRGNWLDQAQLARICAEMTRGVTSGGTPTILALSQVTNLDFLRRVLDCFARLQGRFGMQSLTMGVRVSACQSQSYS
jgi:hypothetical protein